MNSVELSDYIRLNFKPTARSISMRKPVFGVGVNNADYMQQPSTVGGRLTCPAYRAWKSIMSRSYNEKFHKIEPAYSSVVVASEWVGFMNFRKWWILNYVSGYHLDKDIIGSGKVYGPNDCIYIPQWLNAFVMKGESKRGNSPTGVSKDTRSARFVAQCNNPITNKREFVGYFSTEVKARDAYLERKIQHATSLKITMDNIDIRIYPNVINIIKKG